MLRSGASILLAIVVAGCACGGSSLVDAGMDAPRDAGRDAGQDAGRDAGPRDAGQDTGIDGGPDDPGWVRLPGLPDDCAVERASLPERLGRIVWEDCPGTAGCRRIVDTYGGVAGAWFDDRSTSSYVETLHDAPTHRVVSIATSAGVPLAAWRGPPLLVGNIVCAVDVEDIGDGQVAVSIQFVDGDVPSRSEHRVYAVDIGEVGTVTDPTFVLPASPWVLGGRTIFRMQVSASLVAFQMAPDGNVFAWRGGEIRTIDEGTGGTAQNLELVGDHVLWESWGDAVRLDHASWDVARAYFRDVAPGDAKSFGTDGSDIAWLEGHDRDAGTGVYARLELWTAPYVRDLATFAPRRVRDFPIRTASSVGGGWFAIRQVDPPAQRVELYSLRDGHRRTFVPPAGGAITETPFYVREREMFVGPYLVDPSAIAIDEPPDAGP